MGWRAELHLRCEQRAGPSGPRTVLARKHQLGPLTVQRAFYPEGATCHLYPLHPPGGIVGGDTLDFRLDVAGDAHALVTTPGATKLYRSAGPRAEQTQTLTVGRGGTLEWLPQPTILFRGARVQTRTEVRLAAGASFIGWDILSLGRPANDERFCPGALDAAWALHRETRPLLLERLRVDACADLVRPTGLRGQPVVGTFVAAGFPAGQLDRVRGAVAEARLGLFGVTLVDELLVVRALGGSTEAVWTLFCALWAQVRPAVVGRVACPPRIWRT